ncbi:tigger transposable element-derived protein 4-like [Patiria miniata]|uniref:Tigger transposable element-derived protein 4 n=1 Tax=Patiria miniata TaxID=46514 RepID=A0A914BPH8_PATMI|nr:tigger transposable element-derived protein 4-like [Patiria miniata]
MTSDHYDYRTSELTTDTSELTTVIIMTSIKVKRKGLSLSTKMEIIKATEAGRKKGDIAREFGIVPSTLSTVLKNKQDIKAKFELSKFEPSRQRFRNATFEDVEEALLRWFKGNRSKNLPISGPLLREKADQLAKLLGHNTFSASAGWLSRFKERHGIMRGPWRS